MEIILYTGNDYMRLLLSFWLILFYSTASANADSLDLFKSTWQFFKEECALVLKEPYSYMKGMGGANEKITVKVSKDKKAYIFTKGNGGVNSTRERYLDTSIYIFDDREYISCAVFHETANLPKSKKLAPDMYSWLSKQNLSVSGGFVPLYDKSHHQFGVLGVWPDKDLPVRVHLFDWGIQLFVENVVKK